MPKTVSSVYTIGLTPLFHSRRPCYLLLFHPRRRGCPLPPLLAALPLPLFHLRQLPLGAQDALAPEVRIGTVQGEQLIVCTLLFNAP